MFRTIERPTKQILRPLPHRGVDDLLDPVDVARERRDDDAPGRLGEDAAQGLADDLLALHVTGGVRAGRVGEEQGDPRVADLGDVRQVRRLAVDRGLVELEVPRVQDRPVRGVEGGREPVGDRVGDPDELDVERTVGDAVGRGDLDELGAEPGCSSSLALSMPTASGCRRRASPGSPCRKKGRAPMWSSWPWEMTTQWMSSARSSSVDQSGRMRSMP
jgi:hypothetical protein